jgi:hypothetical protein
MATTIADYALFQINNDEGATTEPSAGAKTRDPAPLATEATVLAKLCV